LIIGVGSDKCFKIEKHKVIICLRKKVLLMKIVITVLIGFAVLFSACFAEAVEFAATKKGLPSLVMLSSPR
jgi:hypothetical protein